MDAPKELTYWLCWEEPAVDEEAWVIRSTEPGEATGDRWIWNDMLGQDEVTQAKAWASQRLTEEGVPVEGWRREKEHYPVWEAMRKDHA